MFHHHLERWRNLPTQTLADIASSGLTHRRAFYHSLSRDQLLRVLAAKTEDRDIARYHVRLPYKLQRMSILRAIEAASEGTTTFQCSDCGMDGPWLLFHLPSQCLACAIGRKRRPSYNELTRREVKRQNPLPQDHLDLILERQRFRCFVCKMPIARHPGCGWQKATLDHDLPIAAGGTNHADNAQYALCRTCNSSKNTSRMGDFMDRWQNLAQEVTRAGGKCPDCHRPIWVTSHKYHPNRATLYQGMVRCRPCVFRLQQDSLQTPLTRLGRAGR